MIIKMMMIMMMTIMMMMMTIMIKRSVGSKRAGTEGGRLVPPSLPAPDTPFQHKEHKIGFSCDYVFPITTSRKSRCGYLVSGVAPWSVRLLQERGAHRAGLPNCLPSLISHRDNWNVWQRLKRGEEERQLTGEHCFENKFYTSYVWCERGAAGPEEIAEKSTFLRGPRGTPEVVPMGGVPMWRCDSTAWVASWLSFPPARRTAQLYSMVTGQRGKNKHSEQRRWKWEGGWRLVMRCKTETSTATAHQGWWQTRKRTAKIPAHYKQDCFVLK